MLVGDRRQRRKTVYPLFIAQYGPRGYIIASFPPAYWGDVELPERMLQKAGDLFLAGSPKFSKLPVVKKELGRNWEKDIIFIILRYTKSAFCPAETLSLSPSVVTGAPL